MNTAKDDDSSNLGMFQKLHAERWAVNSERASALVDVEWMAKYCPALEKQLTESTE